MRDIKKNINYGKVVGLMAEPSGVRYYPHFQCNPTS